MSSTDSAMTLEEIALEAANHMLDTVGLSAIYCGVVVREGKSRRVYDVYLGGTSWASVFIDPDELNGWVELDQICQDEFRMEDGELKYGSLKPDTE